jgi:ribosomal protein S6
LNQYEALFILNTAGKDENAPDLIEALKKDLEAAGAVIKAVQKMDRKVLARPIRKVTAGYYVNFVFDAAPSVIAALRPKLALNETVLRVQFLTHEEPKASHTAAA